MLMNGRSSACNLGGRHGVTPPEEGYAPIDSRWSRL